MMRLTRFSLTALCLALAAGCASARVADETARLVEALRLEPGMRVADVGAGDGEWSEALAEVVGEAGHVYATEVGEEELGEIRERIETAGLAHVTPVLGTATDTGLPDGCCEAVLLRLVYHHFTDPAPMRASLRRALKPGGVLAVVDMVPQSHWRELPGVPERGGHGIAADDLVAEMTADGFEVVARYDDWPGDEDHYCVVFRAAAREPRGPEGD